jgi:hypothetical protein
MFGQNLTFPIRVPHWYIDCRCCLTLVLPPITWHLLSLFVSDWNAATRLGRGGITSYSVVIWIIVFMVWRVLCIQHNWHWLPLVHTPAVRVLFSSYHALRHFVILATIKFRFILSCPVRTVHQLCTDFKKVILIEFGIPVKLVWLITVFYVWLNSNSNVCRSQWPCGLRRGSWPVGCWDRGLESRSRHGCLSASFCAALSCVGRDLATGWSLVQGVLPYV